ncbi:MAG: hypothetical protein ACO3K7_00810 [Candidatus Marinamargulisbacteria bacterium]
MKTFKLLTKNNTFHSDAIRLLMDKSKINRFKTIQDYCQSQNETLDATELKQFTQKIERLLYDQTHEYAHLMYHYMQVSGDWGEPGEQQVKTTFCRNLLRIDPKTHISTQHANEFEEKVAQTIQTLGMKTLSPNDAQQKLRLYTFKLFDTTFELFKLTELNRHLQFLGSNKFIHSGQYGRQMELIFGKGHSKKRHGYRVIFIQKEYIRTPNNIMSMAAIIGHQTIYIRLESLATIFAQKWVQIFDYSEFEMINIHANPYWNIGEGIKQTVLEHYGIQSKNQLIKYEKTLLNDMSETILYHELGHGIVQHTMLPFELTAMGEASKIYGENIFTAMLEFLADFSPENNNLKGPIQNIIAISHTDKNRATRMYLMYLSDIWFYNTDDTYMYTYSDLMTLILIRYIKKNGDINFKQLATDLAHTSPPSTARSHFDHILSLYIERITPIKKMCETALFKVSGDDLSYQKVREFLIDEFRKNDGFVHVDTYEFMVPFWSNIFGYIQSISNAKTCISDYIQDQQPRIIKEILILSCGKSTAENYKYDHRKYIVDRMSALGFLAINPD